MSYVLSSRDFVRKKGIKQVKMPQFCRLWSQNVRLVNAIQIQNDLSYVSCFVNIKCSEKVSVHLADRLCCVTKVAKHLTLWQTPCRAKNLTFDLETVLH